MATPDDGWEAVMKTPRSPPFDEKCEILIPVQRGVDLAHVAGTQDLPSRFKAMLKSCEFQPKTAVPVPLPELQELE